MNKVILNKDLLTNIFSYLNKSELKSLVYSFRSNVHFDYIVPPKHVLLYGQVQSGKTDKIMEYVKNYKPYELKIIIIQNNVCMLSQYTNALKTQGISYKEINKRTSSTMFNYEQVLITIHNKYRMNALFKFIKQNKINKYCLILDESDQYLKEIQKDDVFTHAKNVLHVTATPFKYVKQFKVDKVITIKPKLNYIGVDNVNIVPFIVDEPAGIWDKITKINDIIVNDFLKSESGFMLINCFSFIVEMKQVAISLSLSYPTVPFIVLSTNAHTVINGVVQNIKIKNMQKFIDSFNKYSHIVFIANRLSSRGVNYTTSDYSRNITHQVSKYNGNYTSFIQKCRIFGVRKNTLQKPTIYCLVNDDEKMMKNFIGKLKKKINNISEVICGESISKPIKPIVKKINMPQLKNLCRINKVKGFSTLKKAQLIELLTKHDVDIYGDQEQKV